MVRNKGPVARSRNFSATKSETAALPEVAYRIENCGMLARLIIQNMRPVAVAYNTFEFQIAVIQLTDNYNFNCTRTYTTDNRTNDCDVWRLPK